MKLKINATPEIFEECPIITADIIIDLREVGAEQSATSIINALRSGLNIYNRLEIDDFMDIMKRRPKSVMGLSLVWIK